MANIILLSPTFLPSIGGRELVIYYLARSLQEQGHEVRIVGPTKWWSNRNQKLTYKVHRYPSIVRKVFGLFGPESKLREKELFLQLLFDIRIWGCDVIHAHTTYPSGYIASKVIKKVNNCKLVITPHGIDIHAIPEIGHGKRLNPRIKLKIDEALGNADTITAISAGIESSLLQAGADKNKIIKIPNGVDIKRFEKKSKIDVRHELQIPKDSLLITTVGNYHPRKGHEFIIRAMPLILKSEPRTRLIIVGNGTNVLKNLIKDLSLDEKVKLTGAIDFPLHDINNNVSNQLDYNYDMLAAIHQSSEAYISAGVEEGAEGLSLAVLEAMASSLPIIGTNISGNRDIIKHNYNGLLVKPADFNHLASSIIQLLKDDNMRKSLGENAKHTIRKFDWSEITKLYIDLYNKLNNTINNL